MSEVSLEQGPTPQRKQETSAKQNSNKLLSGFLLVHEEVFRRLRETHSEAEVQALLSMPPNATEKKTATKP